MKALIFLFILLPAYYSKELRKISLHKRRLTNDESPTTCPLYYNAAVPADFEHQISNVTSHSSPSPPDITLAIALWSNETGFAYPSDEGLSKNFVCGHVECTEENSTFEFLSPWLRSTTKRIHLDKPISIGRGAWQLRSSALSVDLESMGKAAKASSIGWIGLGTGSEAKKNFRDENPMFSLLLNKSYKKTGSLIFGFDPSIADIDKPIMVVLSDANWRMQLTSLSFDSAVHFDSSEPLPVMFDLMYQGINLPERTYDSLLHKMITYNITCYFSLCKTGDLNGLPSLVFGLSNGKNISLSPNNYMKRPEYDIDEGNEYYLLLRKIEDRFYYEDHIILGWDVLADFYTLFQQTDGVNTISFYEINSATVKPQSPSISNSQFILIVIILILVAILIGVGAVIFITKKSKPNKEPETTELSKVETSERSGDPQEQNQLL